MRDDDLLEDFNRYGPMETTRTTRLNFLGRSNRQSGILGLAFGRIGTTSWTATQESRALSIVVNGTMT
jgi:hypothetical protein